MTLTVIGSYLFARLFATLRTEQGARLAYEELHIRNARRIRRAIVHLQGVFIKVGQTFSILTNFLPPEFRAELEALQDAVPARPWEATRARFRADFGKEPDEVFASFQRTPIAAASIAQVHLAVTLAGEKVAVKVQHPEIDVMMRQDLRTFRRILRIVSFFYPTQGLETVHREVADMLTAELDFEAEARHMETIGKSIVTMPETRVRVPKVFASLSTKTVLTLEFVDGMKISSREKLDALGLDRTDLARRIVAVYCRQIFTDGFYHADPHPGNLLVESDGTITLLDFGAVASVSAEMRRGIAHFLQGVLNQDTTKIAQALKEMGFIANTADPEIFDRVVAYFHDRFRESVTLESFNLNDIKIDPERGMEHLLALRQMNIGLGELSTVFRIPRQWILLERTVLLLTGLCTHLDPAIRPMELLRPYLRDFVLGEEPDWSAFAVETGKDALFRAIGLPAELHKLIVRANAGRLEVRSVALESGARRMYALGHQLLFTLVGISAAVIATLFHIHNDVSARDAALDAAWVAGGLVLFSMLQEWRRGKS